MVTLKIYDTSGRICKTLVDEELSPGSYEIQVGAEHLPAGLLFCELRTGAGTERRKMISQGR